jgi:hypothetical protein
MRETAVKPAEEDRHGDVHRVLNPSLDSSTLSSRRPINPINESCHHVFYCVCGRGRSAVLLLQSARGGGARSLWQVGLQAEICSLGSGPWHELNGFSDCSGNQGFFRV